jgi:hypothetical protein
MSKWEVMLVDAAFLCLLLLFWCQGLWANKGVSLVVHVKRNKVNASSDKPKEGVDSRNVVRKSKSQPSCSYFQMA